MAEYPYRQFATEENTMMTHQHDVRYGYFPDFKGDSVVLFVGDRVARTPDTVWQLLIQLYDFIGIKNRHCELW